MCAESIILVFSVTSRKSFEYIVNLSQWLKKRKGKDASFTIIANKTDLNHKRQINKSEAVNFAKSVNASYFEISAARDIEAIKDIFLRVFCSIEEITRTAISDKRKKSKSSSQPVTEPKRKHSSIRDIFKKRPSVWQDSESIRSTSSLLCPMKMALEIWFHSWCVNICVLTSEQCCPNLKYWSYEIWRFIEPLS